MAEAAFANIQAVGMPQWSAADQAFVRSVQTANKLKVQPLGTAVMPLSTPETRGSASIGGTDDIGDVMWAVPTITLGYTANIPNEIGRASGRERVGQYG